MTAELVLTTLLRVDFVAAAAVLLVLALRLPVRHRFGARVAYGLWLAIPLAALGAVLPARVADHGPNGEVAAADVMVGLVDAASPGTRDPFDPYPALLAVWAVGAIVFMALALWRSRRLAAHPMLGPALVGVFRPRLVLPADFETRFDEAERRLILAHEAAHARAGHPVINAMVEVARCLNWFNPLAHLAVFHHRVDQELACDAAVLAQHPTSRRTYARALAKSQLAPGFLPLGCQWPGRTQPLITERVEMLTQSQTSRARRVAGALAVASLGLGAACAAWAAQPPRAAATDAALLAAIRAGDGLAVRELGGSPQDVVAALKAETKARQPGGAAYAARTQVELDRFADVSAGARLAFVPFQGPDFTSAATGRSVGAARWCIERATPDRTVQYVCPMQDGRLFVGAPHPAPAAAAGRASDVAAKVATPPVSARPGRVVETRLAQAPAVTPRKISAEAVRRGDVDPYATPTVLRPVWTERPGPADINRLFPDEAAKQGLGAQVVMTCRFGTEGRLDNCGILRSQVEGADAGQGQTAMDFGTATLKLAKLFRAAPQDAEGKPVAGGVIRIPVRWAPLSPAPR